MTSSIYQWDLNYANPTVFNDDMTENLFFLCNQGAGYHRIDAGCHILRSRSARTHNLPQVTP